MATLILFALSNLLTMLATAWLLHRRDRGLSPVPSFQHKVEVANGDGEEQPVDVHFEKGRPVL